MHLLELRQIPDECWLGCFFELGMIFWGFCYWDVEFQRFQDRNFTGNVTLRYPISEVVQYYSCHFPTSLSSKWWDLKHVTYGQKTSENTWVNFNVVLLMEQKPATSTGCLLVWRSFAGWPDLIWFCQVTSTYFNSKMSSTGKKQSLRNDLHFYLIFFVEGFPVIISSLSLGVWDPGN